MSLLEELEDLIGDPETVDEGEERGEPLFLEDEANEQNDGDGDAVNDHVSQTVPQSDNPVQPKKKRVKNPQPKLNAERLKGPRGLTALESIFKDYKICGKGYEKRDLDEVMKRLEHWAHRLFPKYQFDDCLEKLETLGHKKPVMVYVKKIRMGLETAESSAVEPMMEDDDLALPLDPFDELLSQQISDIQASIPSAGMPPQRVTLSQSRNPSSPQPAKIILTDEQRERMERNRRIAQERRLQRLKVLQESQEQHEENPITEIADARDKVNEVQASEGQQVPLTETEPVLNGEVNELQSETVESVPTTGDGNPEMRAETSCVVDE